MEKIVLNANKIGNTINMYVNGTLCKKTYESSSDANRVYENYLFAKTHPTEDSINYIVNEFLGFGYQMSKKFGFNYNPITKKTIHTEYGIEVPNLLLNTYKEYWENNYPIDAINNFWKLLMANGDKYVIETLFEYISNYNLVITDNGYFVAYKAVTDHKDISNLKNYVTDKVEKVTKQWKTSAKKYTVFKSSDDGEYYITKNTTFDGWDLDAKRVVKVGNLDELNSTLSNMLPEEKTYTDKHTKKMTIKIGEPVHMDKSKCDANHKKDCSYGLHVGAVNYVNGFASNNDTILICLINPMNVVAIPESDHSKIRVSEYFPMGICRVNENREIIPIDTPYMENDYLNYEIKSLNKTIESIKKNVQTDDVIPKLLEERVEYINNVQQ